MLVLRYSESAMDEVRPKLVQLGDARTDTLKPENRPEARCHVILRVASLLSPIRASNTTWFWIAFPPQSR
jgi:hypothetical protein